MAQFFSLAKRFVSEQESLNYRGAMICSILAEGNRDRKKRSKPFTPDDFMPKKKGKVKLTGKQMKDQIEMINVALGGEVR